MQSVAKLESSSATGSRGTLRCVYLYALVLSTILLSKSVYFGMVNLAVYRWVYYMLVLLGLPLFIKIRNLPVENLLSALVLCGCLTGSVAIFASDMTSSQVNEVIGFALNILVVAIMASYLRFEDFARAYVNCMVGICLVSLPCVLVANINPSLARSFIHYDYDWRVPFGYTPYYTWGINGTINYRNSGMFWEPGAYQGFILVAILLALRMRLANASRARLKVIVLFVTLLTTQSTTGYLLVVFIAIMQVSDLARLFAGKRSDGKVVGAIFAVIMIGALAFIVIGSGNVSAKLAGAGNDSAAVRHGDLVSSAALAFQGGPLGFGDTQTKLAMEQGLLDYADNSVGALALVYTYGWIFGILYFVLMARGIRLNFRLRGVRDGLCLAVVYVVLYFTEGLYWLPLYLAFMFPFADRKSASCPSGVEPGGVTIAGDAR